VEAVNHPMPGKQEPQDKVVLVALVAQILVLIRVVVVGERLLLVQMELLALRVTAVLALCLVCLEHLLPTLVAVAALHMATVLEQQVVAVLAVAVLVALQAVGLA
jgi:hypothetical protein